MPVPFYLQRPDENKVNEYAPENVVNTWNTAENPNEYKSSLVVANDSWSKAELADRFARGMERIINAQPAPSRQRSSSWKDTIDYSNGYNSKV